MKLAIVSNYINHHQIPMSNELYQKLGTAFAFIQTSPMEEDRVKMGWGEEVRSIPYLKLYYEEPEACAARILDSDVVVFGGVEDERYIKPRLNAGKIVEVMCWWQEFCTVFSFMQIFCRACVLPREWRSFSTFILGRIFDSLICHSPSRNFGEDGIFH